MPRVSGVLKLYVLALAECHNAEQSVDENRKSFRGVEPPPMFQLL
jgi:hypothetical protein